MMPLALNFLMLDGLRSRYGLAATALPLTLMFASLWPFFRFTAWIESRYGLEQPKAFVLVLVAGMMAGYVVGAYLNAWVARFLFRWPASRANAVFRHSDIPSHWLQSDALRASADPVRAALARWEQERKAGVFRYVLRHGVVLCGVPLLFVMYIFPVLAGQRAVSLEEFLFQLVLFGGVGVAAGALLWYGSEASYRRLKKKEG